ncbi:iron-containing alcohol dehydrogenase family protein [Rhodococcus sp. 05-340-1]|nr:MULTISPECIES: iron-containing alcohol dehydrogenase family protein [unclassified Rhodococcus (in: high G+C Gram-positive bacteria)]
MKHLSPPFRTYVGSSALASIDNELGRTGCRRVVVVCSPSMRSHAALAKVEAAIGARMVGRFDGVRKHSPTDVVERACAALADAKADSVVVVGGGSAIVTARAATVLLAEDLGLRELCTSKRPDGTMVSPRLRAPKIPQWVVPSTPTTAFAKAGSAILDVSTNERLTLFDPKSRAQGIFVDPDVTLTAPVALIDSSVSNALSMAIAGLLSGVDDPIASSQLEGAVQAIGHWWPRLRSDPEDPEARMRLVLAALLSGQGSDHTHGGIAQVLGHTIGPQSSVANGEIEAIALPAAMRFAPSNAEFGYRAIARALGAPTAGAGSQRQTATDAVRTLLEPAGRRRLRDVGVGQSDLSSIADRLTYDWFFTNLARTITRDEVDSLLMEIW